MPIIIIVYLCLQIIVSIAYFFENSPTTHITILYCITTVLAIILYIATHLKNVIHSRVSLERYNLNAYILMLIKSTFLVYNYQSFSKKKKLKWKLIKKLKLSKFKENIVEYANTIKF
jgi:hypothetical protein